METPSSMKRVTSTQITTASQNKDDTLSKSRTKTNTERSALVDITNDSPIVGLATEKTPSSLVLKNRVRVKNTPGSGEALLRGQVKTLLQKVEEEAEFVNKLPSGNRPPFRAFMEMPAVSPLQLLAPTPMNTPQIPNFSEVQDLSLVMRLDDIKIEVIQIADPVRQEASPTLDECLINRALLFDSPAKSEASDAVSVISSALTYQESEISSCCCTEKSSEDDSSSVWSMQVNVSPLDDYDEEADEDIEDFNEEEEEFNEEEEDEETFDDLCEGLSKIRVEDDDKDGLPEFTGKLTRFVYNSDDEIEGEEVVNENCAMIVSPSVVVLKGLPVPEGKHLRFHEDDE